MFSKKILCKLFIFIFLIGAISVAPKNVSASSWSDNLIFHAPFTDPTNPLLINVGTGQFTYKRTSAATYIYPGTDIVTMSAENTIPQSEDLSTTWSASSTSVVVDQTTAPDGTLSADELIVGAAGDGSRTHFVTIAGTSSAQINASTNQAFTVSAYVKQNTNTWVTVALVGRNGTVNQCYFNTTNGTIGTCSANTIGTATSSTNGFYRFSVSASLGSGSATVSARVYLANGDNVPSWTGDGAKSVYVWGVQMNSGPVLTPYVKTTLDIVSVPRIESAGYLVEGTRQNLILYSRDMSNAAWTKTNTTASHTAVGHDGISNSATVLTATANGGTVCQAVTTAATSSGSVDIKRMSGSGTVSLSMDGGSTYFADISGSLSTSVWYRAVAENYATANPNLCIKLGTSGDSVVLDYAQVEINGPGNTQPAGASFVSSRIPTLSTTNTRYIDKLSVPSSGNWPITEGSFFVIGDVWDTAFANKFFADGVDGSSRVLLHVRSGQGNGSAGILGRTTLYDGSSECSYSSVNVQPQTTTKMATRWSATSGQRGSTAAGATPSNCAFDGGMEITGPIVLGDAHLQDGTRSTWGHMKDFRIYSTAFSDPMMQAATAGSFNFIGSTANAPASVTAATTSSSSVTLTWATPTSDGGSAISDYFIQYKIGAGATSTWSHVASSATTTTITGLTSSTGYTFYVSAINESGTGPAAVGFGTTTSGTAPDTTAPVILSIASSTTQTGATITWSTDETASSSIQYGLTTSYGTTASSSATSSHTVTLSGLTAATLYNFKVFAIDASGNVGTSTNLTFTTASLPVTSPSVTQQSASSVSTSSVTLNGTIVSNNNGTSTVRGFEYGLTTSYGSIASTTGTYGTGSYSQVVTGLTPNTLYHYRAYATNGAGTGTSTDGTFTTSVVPDTTAPAISSVSSLTTQTNATITWNTNESASSAIQYGLTTGYGTVASSSATSSHSVTLSGLTAATLYNYKVFAIDASGNVGSSTNLTFTTSATSDTSAPIISSLGVSSISTSTVLISWSTDEAASSTVQFGSSTGYGLNATSSGTTTHSVVLSGLTQNTIYQYKVTSIDASGNIATSTNGSFKTLSTDITPPGVNSISTSTTDTTATISWMTNEVASTSVQYGLTTAYGNFSATSTANTTHSMTLTGLTQDTTYNFRFASIDGSDNASTSINFTFRTLVTPVSTSTPVVEAPRVSYGGGSSGGSSGSYYTNSTVQQTTSSTTTQPQITNQIPSVTIPVSQGNSEKIVYRNLKMGDNNLEVKKLQKILNSLGFIVSSKGSGSVGKEITNFGTATKAAVIRFQKKYKIDPIGIVGPATRAKIMELAK